MSCFVTLKAETAMSGLKPVPVKRYWRGSNQTPRRVSGLEYNQLNTLI